MNVQVISCRKQQGSPERKNDEDTGNGAAVKCKMLCALAMSQKCLCSYQPVAKSSGYGHWATSYGARGHETMLGAFLTLK